MRSPARKGRGRGSQDAQRFGYPGRQRWKLNAPGPFQAHAFTVLRLFVVPHFRRARCTALRLTRSAYFRIAAPCRAGSPIRSIFRGIRTQTGNRPNGKLTTTIAISNLKGETDKTTTATLLATAFERAGHSITVVDLDPQGSATKWPHLAAEVGVTLPFPVLLRNIQTMKNLRETTNYTIVDCPPSDPGIIDAAISAADIVIVPV